MRIWRSHKKREFMFMEMSIRTEIYQSHGLDFTRFMSLNGTPLKGYNQPNDRLKRIQATSRPDHIWPDALTRIGKAAQRRKQE